MSETKKNTAPLTSRKPATLVPPEERSPFWSLPFWWLRWVPAVVLTLLTLYLIYVLGGVALIPILASFALAYLLNPLVTRIERSGLSRALAVVLAMAIVAVAITSFLMFVIPDLIYQGEEAWKKIDQHFEPENAKRYRETIKEQWPLLDELAGNNIETFIARPSSVLGTPDSWIVGEGGLWSFLSTAAASLDLLLVPFFVFYILIDFGGWRESLEDLIPPRFRETFSRLFDEVGRILESYVRGQLFIAMIMAVLYAIGFAAFGVPAWAGIAALSGFLNAIPYVGTALGIVLATGFTLADGGGLWRIGGVVGVFIAVQMIEGYYLTPRILGARLSLHPMAVFLGLLIGGKLFGLLGVILSVPTIAVAKVFLKFLRELYKGSYFYHAGEIKPEEAPSEKIEERFADAADTVLAEQVESESGDEMLAPAEQEDDQVAREKIG
jgi:predicted PurR-regulated permease PerM